jgi:YD repeat-containing protein
MRKILFAALLVSAVLSLECVAQNATDQNPGLQPYQSYDSSNIDAINLFSGTSTVKIPLVSYPQRGGKLSLSFSAVINTRPYVYKTICVVQAGRNICTSTWVINRSGLIVDDQYLTENLTPFYLQGQISGYSVSWALSDGSIHGATSVANGQRAADATGLFSAQTTNGGATVCTTCPTIDPNGIQYGSNSNGTAYRQDPNGNQITGTPPSPASLGAYTSYTDTVGRSIPGPFSQTTTDTSGCTGPLPVSTVYKWQVPGVNGGTETFKFCMATVSGALPKVSGSGTQSFQSPDLQSIVLPNGQTYTFQYVSRDPSDPSSINYGDLSQITLPNGGTISYTFARFEPGNGTYPVLFITSRSIDAQDGQGPHTSTYSWDTTPSGAYTNVATDAAGNATAHVFPCRNPTSSSCANETQATYYQGLVSQNVVLKSTTTAYTYQASNILGNDGAFPTSKTITLDTGQQAKKALSYAVVDSGTGLISNQVTDQKDYDYGSGGVGSLIREIQTSYLFQSNSSYLNANLLNLTSSSSTYSSTGSLAAQKTFTYDEGAYLTSSGISTQHVGVSSPRGNLTTATSWLNTGTSPQSHSNWFDTGEVYQAIDPLSHTTTYAYSTAYAGSLPTQVTNALNQSTTYAYDFDTGKVTSVTDPNQQTITYSYNDPLGRLTEVLYPNVYPGTSVHGERSYTYNDLSSPVNVVESDVVTPSLTVQEEFDEDGLGRGVLTKLLTDPQGTTYSRTSYDVVGRKYQVWNPSRCNPMTASSCPGESTWGITTFQYDAVSRPIKTIPADGSATSDNQTASYSGNTTTFTDEAGSKRILTSDALGRLTQVSEGTAAYITIYNFDALGNLLCVEQHGNVSSTGCSSSPSNDATSLWRIRRFTYDSLSRLITSKNPETGTITYGYNADSVLSSKTDARGITITYTPDQLHRLSTKTYSDSEPTISYTYDATGSNNYGIGRRTGMTDASGSTTWTYDPLGKPWTEAQTISGVQKTFSTLYNADESAEQMTYPSGSVLSISPGGARRPIAITDTVHQINYVQSLAYAPPGEINTAVYGARSGFAGIIESDTFNSRLQAITLSDSGPNGTVMNLSVSVCPNPRLTVARRR